MRAAVLFAALIAIAAAACGSDEATLPDAAADASADAPVDAPACTGLSLMECRATPGCTAEVCTDCTCGQTFAGCFADGAPATCPDIVCPGGDPTCCRADADCPDFCLSPADPPLCGNCQDVPDECDADTDCQATAAGAPLICEPIRCACAPADRCVPGCTDDTTCGDAETCDLATGRCRPLACSPSAPCPPDFDCTATGCTRRPCTTDLTCDSFCVEGACRPDLGICALPPP